MILEMYAVILSLLNLNMHSYINRHMNFIFSLLYCCLCIIIHIELFPTVLILQRLGCLWNNVVLHFNLLCFILYLSILYRINRIRDRWLMHFFISNMFMSIWSKSMFIPKHSLINKIFLVKSWSKLFKKTVISWWIIWWI